MTYDQLYALVVSYKNGDSNRFRSVARCAAASVKSEHKRKRLLEAVGEDQDQDHLIKSILGQSASLVEPLPSVEKSDFMIEREVSHELEQLRLERLHAEQLLTHKLRPRSRILLHGPPGNGKTTFAAVLARELGLSGYVLRMPELRRSYLGETATRLQKVWEITRYGGCLLFIDEIDAVGSTRSNEPEAASREHNATVASLLQMLNHNPEGIVVGATNRVGDLDGALRRRFDIELELPEPTEGALVRFVEKLEERHELRYEGKIPTGGSFADAERTVLRHFREKILEESK